MFIRSLRVDRSSCAPFLLWQANKFERVLRRFALQASIARTRVEDFLDEVFSSYPSQCTFNIASFLWLIPEKELSLGEFVFGCLGTIDGLQCVWIVTSIERLRGDGHRGRGEILNLFQVEIHFLGEHSEFSHIFFTTARVATDEIRNELLAKVLFAVDAVEDAFELLEKPERWLSHQLQDAIGGVFGGYLQSSADVACNEFTRVLTCGFVAFRVIGMVQQQVVSHSTADETFFDFGKRIDSMVDVEQRRVVGIQIGADGWMDARRALAPFAGFLVLAPHSIHVGRRSA